VGIGVPFWAIAGFSMQMPRSGPWMEAIKSVFGIALVVAALYYLKNVVPRLAHLTGHTATFLALAVGAVVLGLALGAIQLSFHDVVSVRIRKGVGVAFASLGLFALTNYILTPKVELAWMHDEAAALHLAQTQQRPVIVDFMADWCLPCKEMDVRVFSNPEVGDELRGFTLLRVDLTREDEDPALGLVKAKYGVNTLPAIRIVSPTGQIVRRFDTVIDVPTFLSGLAASRATPASAIN
jgi:thiol:disulfide interchange protein DsbD